VSATTAYAPTQVRSALRGWLSTAEVQARSGLQSESFVRKELGRPLEDGRVVRRKAAVRPVGNGG